jgi:hypothetical protein
MPEVPPYIGKLLWNDKVIGTGFFVSNDGLIATCYHVLKVVGDPPIGKTVMFQLLTQDRIVKAAVTNKLDPKHDVALLQAIEPFPSEIEVARLVDSNAVKPGAQFSVIGYGEIDDPGHTYKYVSARGEIIGPVSRDGVDLLQLESKQILRGMSGAPVVVEELGEVVGVISGRYSVHPDQTWMRDTGWAAKSEALVALDDRLQLQQHKALNKLRAKVMYTLRLAQYFVGRQSHLRTLREFWNEDTQRVIGLVGMGGTGKTAIVRQFLETQHWLESEDAPDSPDGLFVWSFYDNPDAAGFITEAYLYFSQLLKEEPTDEVIAGGRRTNVFKLADVLDRTNRCFLIIMDGLEKMQSEGTDELPRGALKTPPLRHFLRRIVDGVCGQTKAIITSRFPLTDLEDWSGKQYRELNVDKLEPEAARALLRKLGVHGSDDDIDLLADEYGLHALTLDLLGRLLTKYFNGDVSGAKDFPVPILEHAYGSPAIERQAKKLTRVLQTYEDKLAPLELTALECLSVFRRPVDFDFLKDVFLGKNIVSISKGMASLTPQELKAILYALEELWLVHNHATSSTMESGGS